MKGKLRNQKQKELKESFKAQTQAQNRFNFKLQGTQFPVVEGEKLGIAKVVSIKSTIQLEFCPKVLAGNTHTDPKKRTTGSILT